MKTVGEDLDYLKQKIKSLLSSGRKFSKVITYGKMENRKWTNEWVLQRKFPDRICEVPTVFLAISHELWLERNKLKKEFLFASKGFSKERA